MYSNNCLVRRPFLKTWPPIYVTGHCNLWRYRTNVEICRHGPIVISPWSWTENPCKRTSTRCRIQRKLKSYKIRISAKNKKNFDRTFEMKKIIVKNNRRLVALLSYLLCSTRWSETYDGSLWFQANPLQGKKAKRNWTIFRLFEASFGIFLFSWDEL